MDKLIAAAEKAGVSGERIKAEDTGHQDTKRLFLKVDELLAEAKAAKQRDEQRKLQDGVDKKFSDLEP